MKEYITTELNSCRVNSDCRIASGTCPLGPFFFVNKENEKSLDSIITEIHKTCGTCKYDMPRIPTTVLCKNFKCYPGFNERTAVLMLFGYNCEKIVNLYSEELIGKKIQELHLIDLYRVIQEDDTEAIISEDPDGVNRVKVIVDKEGNIKSLRCDK